MRALQNEPTQPSISPTGMSLPSQDREFIMQLYASGFNAWDQLNFGKGEQKSEEQPSDYRDFVEVFADDRIDKVWASLTAVRGMSQIQAILFIC